MKKEFVEYNEALELKELDFDEPCIGRYNVPGEFILSGCYSDSPLISILVEQNDICESHTLAPTFSQAFDWFEKQFKLYVEWLIDGWDDDDCVSDENICYRVFIWEVGKPKPDDDIGAGTKEQMNIVVLRELIKIVKNANKND